MTPPEFGSASHTQGQFLHLTLPATPSGAAGGAPLTAACVPGAGYDPACEVDHDGDVDIFNIFLPGIQRGQTGTHNYPAMVPKTGQTTSYAVGDDGARQKGVTWPSPRFTDNSNGTVTDNLTGLTWLKNVDCFGQKNWAMALSNANTLNSGECGLTDGSVEGNWRLPNVRELQSLLDYGRSFPALPSGHPFTGVFSYYYWTSTSADGVQGPLEAWIVGLTSGDVTLDGKIVAYRVWPVRGGQ